MMPSRLRCVKLWRTSIEKQPIVRNLQVHMDVLPLLFIDWDRIYRNSRLSLLFLKASSVEWQMKRQETDVIRSN